MSGSAVGDRTNHEASKMLMVAMIETDRARLVLDDRGVINAQYNQKMVQGTYGHEWVRQMASKGKIKLVHWRRVDRGTRSELADAHFDWEDFKYVRTANESNGKKLVSHDPDYSPRVQRILKRRLSIAVLEANGASHFVAGTSRPS